MLKRLILKRFTVFDAVDLEFSPGINVLIGANATGKTHVMKLAYSVSRALKDQERPSADPSRPQKSLLADRIAEKLAAIFRPDEDKIGRLVRRSRGRNHLEVQLEFSEGDIDFTLSTLGNLKVRTLHSPEVPTSTFLPAREMISIYPGFMKAYKDRELAFDETYFDLALALSGSPLRGPRGDGASLLWRPLGDHLRANVSLEGDRFYLSTQEDGKIEAHLAAEGFRKIAGVMHLIANGSLMRNGVLFWDEPEATLNPKLIKIVADFLLRLAQSGIQVFVATHDYLLTNELSLHAEYRTEAVTGAPIRFFAFHRNNEQAVEVQSGLTLAELDQNPIMEEFAALYDRERNLFYEREEVE